ncbi:ABC transporter permease [Bremerella sp. T1]|uniref:ABC transporter permease n=1 Tax=Bremerella sp. TYQ1 TaxID=3119568 RepID=UPI001CD01D06|nr:ABC transporter permease [Bremerella volcania]UBM36572.1 ABC transporter permease [Bremerella volcania]
MTTVDIAAEESASPSPETRSWWQTVDRRLEDLGEYLNPILVKETRQALKSRHFAITFALVLLTSWIWSLLAIYFRYPGILYSPDGPYLMVGYVDILLFPLIVIIPFSAFRSLASEREDGTFELLSISTLSPRQIITGKLISSMVQMLVYLSALAPCLAFTYLLRGIDIITIGYVLCWAFLASVLLSGVGLVLACVTQQRHWQSALSVIVILLFIFLFIVGLVISYGSIYEDSGWRMYDNSDFWLTSFALLTVYASYLYLLIEVASAQITFASENRSAGIRRAMLIQHLLAIGWLGYMALRFPQEQEILMTLGILLALHWFIMGAFINGESPTISPRIKRGIPTFSLDRIWRNWLIPGPDRGYLFVVTSLLSGLIIIGCVAFFNSLNGLSSTDSANAFFYAAGLMTYCMCFLSIGRLIMRLVTLVVRADIFVSVILHLILLVTSVMLPLGFQVLTNRTMDRNFNHWTNPFWFFVEGMDDSAFVGQPWVTLFVVAMMVFSAGLFLLNFLLSARKLFPTREVDPRFLPENLPETLEPTSDPLA